MVTEEKSGCLKENQAQDGVIPKEIKTYSLESILS